MCSLFGAREMGGERAVEQELADNSGATNPLDQKMLVLWGRMDRPQKEKMLKLMERLIRHQGGAKSP